MVRNKNNLRTASAIASIDVLPLGCRKRWRMDRTGQLLANQSGGGRWRFCAGPTLSSSSTTATCVVHTTTAIGS